jgi:hypothetical protein
MLAKRIKDNDKQGVWRTELDFVEVFIPLVSHSLLDAGFWRTCKGRRRRGQKGGNLDRNTLEWGADRTGSKEVYLVLAKRNMSGFFGDS